MEVPSSRLSAPKSRWGVRRFNYYCGLDSNTAMETVVLSSYKGEIHAIDCFLQISNYYFGFVSYQIFIYPLSNPPSILHIPTFLTNNTSTKHFHILRTYPPCLRSEPRQTLPLTPLSSSPSVPHLPHHLTSVSGSNLFGYRFP